MVFLNNLDGLCLDYWYIRTWITDTIPCWARKISWVRNPLFWRGSRWRWSQQRWSLGGRRFGERWSHGVSLGSIWGRWSRTDSRLENLPRENFPQDGGFIDLHRRFVVPPEKVCCPSREGLLSFQRWLVVPPERVSCPLTGFINLVLNLPSENFPQDWGLIVPLEDSVSLFRRHLDVMPSGCSWTVFFLPMISTDHLQNGVITSRQFRSLVIFWRFNIICTALARILISMSYQKQWNFFVSTAIELPWTWNKRNDDWRPLNNMKVEHLFNGLKWSQPRKNQDTSSKPNVWRFLGRIVKTPRRFT